jgi:DNA-binding NtrC family response regulator
VQTKLLRVLQERTFERVGSSESIKVDVRIIAATHQRLEELIRQGRFREDLYYRLNVFPVTVPPLRQRREDVPELTLHFLQIAAKRCGKAPLVIDDDALAALKAFDWPGNIRQLENAIERTVVLVEGSTIRLADLPEDVRAAWLEPALRAAAPANGTPTHMPSLPRKSLLSAEDIEELERDRIFQALAAAGGNKAQAARELRMARSTLISRLKKYGVL